MMKYISKLICLLGVSVFVGISVLYITNIVNGNQIKVPTQLDLHRPTLQSLFLGNRGQQASITITDDKLSIFNGLIMGEGNFASSKASLVTIGGGSSNSLGDVEKSGIGGGNNNSINTDFSVIGGGSGNTTSGDSSQGVAIAGGMNNQAGNGGAILGGEDNVVDGTGVILGGQNNTLQGNGIALGSNSNGGDGSFSWNSPYSQDSSAVIVASGGILVGTYDPITGVNLVVDGSMKISEDDNKQDIAGEVKMMSGCFYGYDGNVWHVINRSSGVECPKVACDFGSTLLYPGQTGQAYSSSYSADCSEELVDVICNEDGTLGSYEDGILGSGGDYYSYCYNLSSYGIKEAKCGNINGGSYRNLSSTSSNLCKGSTVQDWIENDTEFLWKCNIGDSTVECSARKSFVSHEDGLFTICNPNNDAECLTLMDKNLGASIPGLGEESYGNHYKWGNNYGFPNVNNLPTSEVRAIWDDSYNKKGYYGDTFIIHGNYWDDRMLHRDLWGGSGDVASNGYGYPMTNPTDRQGPCPEGYHVPSIGEWGKVVERWYARYGGNIGFQGTAPFVYFTDTQARNQFQNDFLIPYAGYRRWSSGRWDGKGTNADLWASFMNQDGGAAYLNLIKGGGNVVNTQTLIGMSHGASIRCFKNEVNEAKCGVANCNVYDSLLSNSSDLCKGSSVQNWTSSDTGYSWVCSNGINEVKCSAKKSLVSHDGGLITICNPDNNAECLTLMDKNLGAGVVGTGNESYGKYYQWGNNYGFSSTGGVSSSSIKVDASGYGPNNYYSGSTYILAPETPYDWSSVPNGNLWGGTTNTYWAMRGPCPDGYHVPTSGEWSKLISWWSGSMYNNSCSTMGDQFRDAFLIPFAGYRNFSSTDIYYQGVDAYYWSSSANNGSNADTAYRMYFTSSYGHTKNPNRRTYAFQLRCFKNPENSFADLEMYFLTNGGNAKYYAMMDRNLGATAYMDQPGKTSGDRNGDYYQWGNNYGFPNYGTITNTSNEKVDVSLYGPGNYYSSDTFIIGDDGKGWLREQNENLWGGNGSEIDRQGPCPQGYHIPKKDEFENLVQIWKESTNYPLEHLGKLWSSDTLMPFAGTRSVPSPRSQGVWGIYWLSSSKPEYYASNMEFQALINNVATYSHNNACHSVRCFKNSSTPSITLHPNGGTGALIIVHNGKITKLLEPSKGGAIFGGWYADAGYTSEVHVGDTAPAHLYAKWVDSAFLQCGTYNPSDFKDLDIYFLTDEGTTGHYTLMDRNLGATQVYTGVANVCTYGYHYQWGNNYGFPDNEILKQSNNKVDVSLYGSGNYYSSDIFISVHGESWMIDGNDNLWGGNGSEIDRQGPCPQGYHIPKKAEFQGLISNWEKSISPTSYTGRQRSLDALMPLAGVRDDIYSVRSQGYYGWYWTASRKPDHYAYRVMFGPNEIHINNYSADYVAESVRCFKNSSTPFITLHPNGGTGALIIVYDGKITKLGTPHKGNQTFGGWYWDSGYTSKAKTGDTVPASAHLYAKRGDSVPLQCGTYNPSNFKDLDMYFLTDEGITGHYTLMDRNLGATQVYTGVHNVCTYGYYYQWGNNYGFPNQGSVNTSTVKVSSSGYGPDKPYSSDTFILGSDGWSNDYNNNLRGGNGSEIDRKGPCPVGYHIPTRDEFVDIVNNYWEKSADYVPNKKGRQRALDSLMPFAGVRYYADSLVYNWGSNADYWSASGRPDTPYSYFFYFSSGSRNPQVNDSRSYGLSLRCFKNSSTPSMTLHPNGGTGALIIVHDGKITKLGIPSNGGATFGGWYSDAGYTSLVHVGDTAPAHLYAKWVGITPTSSAKCGSANEGSYVNLSDTSINLCEEGTVKNRTLSDMEFSWVCDDGDTKVNCSATRLYEVQLLGDDKDMNDFVYGIIRIGDDYIMDRNLGATAVWDGITKRGGKGKDYNYDYDGYFYEWGNNYGFSNDGKCSLMGLSDEDMKEYVCEYDNEGQILPSSCVYGEFICPTNGPWFYTNSKETSYKMWGKRNKLDYNTSGPCPEGWHIPTLAEVENVVSQLKEDQILLYGGGFHSAYGRDMGGNLPSDGSLQYYVGDEKVLSWFWMAGEATLDKTHEYNKYFAPYFEIKCELDKEGVCHDVKYSHAKAHTEIGLPVRCFRNRN